MHWGRKEQLKVKILNEMKQKFEAKEDVEFFTWFH